MPSSTATSSRPRARRLALPLAAAAFVGLVAALLSPLAANAAVALSGTVAGPTGTAMSGVKINVIDLSTGSSVATATSGAGGAFTVPALAPDDYTLKFDATSTTFAQYLGGTSVLANAQPLGLDGGAGDKSFLKVTLSASGGISGTVKTTSGTSISGATITVYQAKDAKWIVVKTVTTTSKGAYSVTGLQPGAYRVQAKKGTTYAPVYSGGAASILAASDVGVVASKTSSSNFRLGAPAKVSGVVRADTGSGAAPLAGVKVTAWRFVGPATAFADVEKTTVTATTNAAGAYTLVGLTPGDYTLYFDAPASSAVGSTFLGYAAEPKQAQHFVVTSGASVTGKSITLVNLGTISGVFTRTGSGSPIPDVRVSLYGDNEDPDDPLVSPRQVVFTQTDGSFLFTNVGPGNYDVVFGAFEKSTPSEDIDWERRGWSTINLDAGENETGVSPTSIPRTAPAPQAGFEPYLSFSGVVPTQVGTYATAEIGTWDSSGYNVVGAYRWYRDGVLIPGEVDFQYAFRAGDVGHTISADVWRIDWAKGYGEYRTAPSAPVVTGEAPTINGTYPAIIGSARVGKTIGVNPGGWEVIDYSGDLAGADLGILWSFTWQRSTDASTWTTIETAPTHVVTAADLTGGPYLRVHMHGERYGYADIEYDTTWAFVTQGEFLPVKAPSVTATTTTFTANPGTWTPAPGTVEYSWQVFKADNTVDGAALTTQSISRTGLAGKKVTLTITLKSPEVEDEQIVLLVQKGKAPTATGSLAVTGTARVGTTLSAPALTWSFTPDTLAHQWQYLSGTKWRSISGATSNTYTPTANYLGKKLRVIVTAITAGYPNVVKTSAATGAVATGLAPAGGTPMFMAAPAANVTVTVDPGTWTPTPTSFSYVWKQGPTASGPWTTIPGVTTAAYLVPGSLYGKHLQVTVTAKRTGHASTVSVISGAVVKGKLVNTVKPTVVPDASPFPIWTVTNPGTWGPEPATGYGYNWILRDIDGSEAVYASVPGHPEQFDTSVSGAWAPLDVEMTATAPVDWLDGTIRLPVKDGTFRFNDPTDVQGSTAKVGTSLVGVLPNLLNAPLAAVLSPQWEVRTSGATWAPIAGATSSSWVPTASFVGKDVRLKVTITADRYATAITTSPTRTVTQGDAPVIGSGGDAPTFSTPLGMLKKTTVNPGTWSVAGLTFSYQWQKRGDSGDPWVNIAGATTASLTPTEAMHDNQVQVLIKATKAGYPTVTEAVDAGTVGEGQLTALTLPVVSKSGSTLTVSNGTWNTTGLTFSYQWARRLPSGSSTLLGTSKSYTLTADDVGYQVYVEVSANKPNFALAVKSAIGQAGPAIKPLTTITLDGDRLVGSTLTATNVAWSTDLVNVTYQWLRNGVAIAGQTASGYTLLAGDVGKTIALRITATAPGYPTYVSTIAAGTIRTYAPPALVTAPVLSVAGGGTPQVGKTVSTTNGAWSLTGLTFTYQWYRGEAKIPGATASTYVLGAADLAYEITAQVTTNKAGITSATAETQSVTVLPGPAPTAAVPVVSVVGGTTLTATAVTWSLPSTVTYQWQQSVDGNTWDDVIGGTSTTLPKSAINGGWQARIVITAMRPGHLTGTTTSVGIVP